MSAVVVNNLVKSYGEVRALDGLSFEVLAGEIFALVGPNGAGKTTTLEILEGYKSPDKGEVEILGMHPQKDGRILKRQVGLMLQEPCLYPGIRVAEALKLFSSFYENPVDIAPLIERVGLKERVKSTTRRLSRGEKQRLSLALAIVGKPKILFLDEPTAGLDAQVRAEIWKLIEELRSGGATVLFTTHLLEEAERFAGRLAIIHRGRLMAVGSHSELRMQSDRITFDLASQIDTATLSRSIGQEVERIGPSSYRVVAKATPEFIRNLTSALAEIDALVLSMNTGAESLNDIFLRITGEGSSE